MSVIITTQSQTSVGILIHPNSLQQTFAVPARVTGGFTQFHHVKPDQHRREKREVPFPRAKERHHPQEIWAVMRSTSLRWTKPIVTTQTKITVLTSYPVVGGAAVSPVKKVITHQMATPRNYI